MCAFASARLEPCMHHLAPFGAMAGNLRASLEPGRQGRDRWEGAGLHTLWNPFTSSLAYIGFVSRVRAQVQMVPLPAILSEELSQAWKTLQDLPVAADTASARDNIDDHGSEESTSHILRQTVSHIRNCGRLAVKQLMQTVATCSILAALEGTTSTFLVVSNERHDPELVSPAKSPERADQLHLQSFSGEGARRVPSHYCGRSK